MSTKLETFLLDLNVETTPVVRFLLRETEEKRKQNKNVQLPTLWKKLHEEEFHMLLQQKKPPDTNDILKMQEQQLSTKQRKFRLPNLPFD